MVDRMRPRAARPHTHAHAVIRRPGRPACPRCGRPLPRFEVFQVAAGRYPWTVTCACGTFVAERWSSRLAAHAAAIVVLVALVSAPESLPRWAGVALGVATWATAHAVTIPLRRWRAV